MVHLTQLKKQMLGLLFSCIFFVGLWSTPIIVTATQEKDSSAEWITSESAILMEASTGQIILEKNAEIKRSPASITKIMTLLLIFDEMKKGTLKLTDEVTTSEYAKSMGGSQVFLEEGEIQSVETLIKCIAVASGNDASVAMAEKIAGTEEAFVQMMNEKAQKLGMEQTHFLDCCGLSNDDNHYTSAKDVAIMSRELINKHPEVFAYTQIWQEEIQHETAQGTKPFTLSSTNKLLKQYEYATGLKTGSTDKAKYCFSATAQKDGISLIAVVMAAPDYKIRFSEAQKMLEYGFEVSKIYKDDNKEKIPELRVSGGVKERVSVGVVGDFSYLDTKGSDLSTIEKRIVVPEMVDAPISEGDKAGEVVYYLGGNEIGRCDVVYFSSVEKAKYKDYLKKVLDKMLL